MSGRSLSVVLAMMLGLPSGTSAAFVTFESGQVRPLALSPDATRLFALNTPDGRLEILAVDSGGLSRVASVPVGLEPVAVAARTASEVWVVNHLSDSVSVVDVGATPHVVRTLLVGDEPRDIVFAGPDHDRAFITCAHRGQNNPIDPQLTTPGVGRADVWVFDAANLGAALGGNPLTIVTLFGDTPRALAASPDGTTVYAGVFHSGNQTAAVSAAVVCPGGSATPCFVDGVDYPGGLPAPRTDADGVLGPQTGLIVKFNQSTGHWEDRLGRNWDHAVRFSLPDDDVFQIDAAATPPVPRAVPGPGAIQGEPFAEVGTILFNMAVNPVSGKVYVTNGDARNEVRFEGPGGGGSTVRGHLHEARITILDPATGSVTPRHLNKHIDYGVVPSPLGTAERSLATPLDMAVTADGSRLYVAGFGSSKVGIFDTATLENDTFVPDQDDHVVVSGGGPSGLALDEARGRLYVLTRFDDGVSVVDTTTRTEIQHLSFFNPEPASVVGGRRFLYDATHTSSNGEAACASCHIFGDFDSLAWDLGNPDDVVLHNPNPFTLTIGENRDFHPLKGPMGTQTLRGMANNGPMHWRGDRTGGNDFGGNALDEDAAFKKFNVAFGSLLGRADPLMPSEMQAFTDFILQVTLPPNPIRALDGSLTPEQAAGRSFFMNPISDIFSTCNACHVLNPASGAFGTNGFSSFENEPQDFKIPHLRNLYQKVGMFGMPSTSVFINAGDNGDKGPQVRGFGFLHDASVDTVFRFVNATIFNGGFGFGPSADALRRQVEAFMLAFDSNLAPVVGQQITLTSTNAAVVGPRIDLLVVRSLALECDLTAKGTVGGAERGWYLKQGSGVFQGDRAEPAVFDATLRAFAATPGQEITYTCVPPGSGVRVGVDRDSDGWFDRYERDHGTDPADPASFPGAPSTTTTTSTSSTTTLPTMFALVSTRRLDMRDGSASSGPARRRLRFTASSSALDPAPDRITPPALGSLGDPTLEGATLRVYNAAGSASDDVLVTLASGWSVIGTAARFGGYRYRNPDPSGPVRSITVRADRIEVRAGGPLWGYTLDEPSQGRIAVRLTLGAGGAWCAAAPARPAGNPPTTTRNDHVDKFVAQPKTAAPAGCPSLP
jgi:YVTN family beta-propeller protein